MSRAGLVTPGSSTSNRSRGSYPSKQFKFGPAPLASFEDLPTDEQNSSVPSSDEERNGKKTSSIIFVVSDHDCAAAVNIADDNTANRPTLLHTPTPKETQRKSSWADVFSFRKSPTPGKTNNERKHSLFNFKFFHKDEPKVKNDVEMQLEELSVRTPTNESPVNTDILCGVQIEGYESPISRETPQTCISPASNLETVIEIHHTPDSIDNDNRTDSRCSLSCQSSCSCDSKSTSEPCAGGESCCETNDEDCPECAHQIVITCDCVNECDEADNEDNDDETNAEAGVDYDYELDLLLRGDELDPSNRANAEAHLRPMLPRVLNLSTSKTSLRSNGEDRLKTTPIERPRSITPINVNTFEAYIHQFEANSSRAQCDKLTITLPGTQYSNRNRFCRKSNPFIWQEFCEKGLKSPQVLRKRANSCFPQISQEERGANVSKQGDGEEDEEELSTEANLTPITPLQNMDEEISAIFHFNQQHEWRAPKVPPTEPGPSSANNNNNNNNIARPPINYSDAKAGIELAGCSCECNTNNSTVNNTISLTAATTTCSEMSSCSELTDTEETEPREEINNFIQRDCESEDQPLVSPPCECICHFANAGLAAESPLIEEVDEENTDDNAHASGAADDDRVLDYDDNQQLVEETSSVSSRLSTSTSSSSTGLSSSAGPIHTFQSMSAEKLAACLSHSSNQSQ